MMSKLEKNKRQDIIAAVAERDYTKSKIEQKCPTVATRLYGEDFIFSLSVCTRFVISRMYLVLPSEYSAEQYSYALWEYTRKEESVLEYDVETFAGYPLLKISLYESVADSDMILAQSNLETEIRKVQKYLGAS